MTQGLPLRLELSTRGGVVACGDNVLNSLRVDLLRLSSRKRLRPDLGMGEGLRSLSVVRGV